jgi:hypothetical protein
MDGRSVDVAEAREQNRRFPRLRARCRVRVRDRYGVWDAETEDVGPRGCRIVTGRPQTVGALLGLTLESESVRDALEVTGQVVWAVRDGLSRAGISFAGSASRPGAPGPGAWFAALAAASGAVEAVGGPDALAASPDGFDVPIDEEPPTGPPSELAQRLAERARELLGAGAAGSAAVILQRAAALAPGDPVVAAMLEQATATRAA